MEQGPRRLAGRYDVLELLGEGGMSRVFRGRDVNLGREVAIKIPRAEIFADPGTQERFVREAKAAASLSHPNIVGLFDFVRDDDGTPFLVMELVDGEDLRRRLGRGPVAQAEAASLMRDILSALGYAHARGFVHRDLSARNILIDARSGRAKVSDFGIARALGDHTLTRTGEMVGSVSYMAPEQAQGHETGPGADLYAAGVLLYEMLTGRLPFTGDTPVQVALKHVQEAPPPPGISPAVDAVVLRAMAKRPEDRYANASDMLGALERAWTGESEVAQTLVRAPAIARVESSEPAPNRVPFIMGLMAILALVGISIGMWLLPPPRVAVPSVVGMKLDEARQRCEALGLRLEVEERKQTRSEEPDTILEQRPEAGEEVRRGEIVRVVLATAPDRVTIPDLTGLAEPVAIARLEALGLKPDVVREESPNIAAGKVIRHSPAAGESTDPRGTVTLVISSGAGKAAVPDIVGMSRSEAELALSKVGMSLVVNGTRPDASQPEDTVLEQVPTAGTMAPKGKKVGVVLSAGSEGITAPDLEGKSLREAKEIAARSGLQLVVEGPAGAQDSVVFQEPLPGDPVEDGRIVVRTDPSVVVPNLVGLTEDLARDQLEQLGLRLGEVRRIHAAPPADEIVGQDPPSGIEARKGTEVHIYVADPEAPVPEPIMTPVNPTPGTGPPAWVPQ